MTRFLSLLLLLCVYQLGAATWLTDSATAYHQARAENKSVLFNFTGSDWCGWCKRLQSEVFSRPEFDSFANDNLVLVEVDFPKSKQLTPAQIKANDALASAFNIRGYPTILLVDGYGKVIGRTGYQPGGAKMYVSELQRILGNRVKVPYADKPTAPTDAAAPTSKPRSAEPAPRPMFGGASTAPVKRHTGLQLKAVTGQKSRPLAIINNETIAIGETAMVRYGDGQVKVQLDTIGKDSATVKLVDTGERIELQLGASASAPKTAPVIYR
jgi:thioredoxin-related protein